MDERDKIDDIIWSTERKGYGDASSRYVPVVEIPKSNQKPQGQDGLLSIRAEERFGSLIAAAGTIWAVYVGTTDYNTLWTTQILPPGPVEICALGVLAWLHAKWRRSVKA